ncbi:MAG: hypothetical protein JWO38_6991, partial [Gemmataceae bacterium]|nr:hypothetical protein [Gemmataceae bacterium]
ALVSATLDAAGRPDGPVAQAAAAHAAALARESMARRIWFAIAILLAIVMSAAGFQARAATAGAMGGPAGSCHPAPP